MLTISMFTDSLSGAAPPREVGLPLQALWWAQKGDWDRAHACVQQGEGEWDCDLVHAHLHRQEGDLENARQWYHAAGRATPDLSLADEWKQIAVEVLGRG